MIKIEIEYEAMHFEKYKTDDTYIYHKTRVRVGYELAITYLEWIIILLDFIKSLMFGYLQPFFGSATVGECISW